MKPLLIGRITALFAYLGQVSQVASTAAPILQVPNPWRQEFSNMVSVEIAFLSKDLDLPESFDAVLRFQKELADDTSVTHAELLWKFHCLRQLLQSEMMKHFYLSVPDNLAMYYEKDKPLGEKVYDSFSAARFDLSQAGTSLACGCKTAAAFHLMRA
ncbi:MAG TPA: hypothetical protein VIW93_08290, partial [Candidatus Acidoferrum sp.]